MGDKKYWYLVSYSVHISAGVTCTGHSERALSKPWGPFQTNGIADEISKENGFSNRVSIISVFKLHDE